MLACIVFEQRLQCRQIEAAPGEVRMSLCDHDREDTLRSSNVREARAIPPGEFLGERMGDREGATGHSSGEAFD